MISAERVAMLKFMADNKGITPHRFADMGKRGVKMPEHASMISVTPCELAELLEAYEEKIRGVQS